MSMLRLIYISLFFISSASSLSFKNILPLSPIFNSVLSEGDIYKLSVDQTGVFKLDYNFIKNELGVANIDSKDPRNIQLFSFGAGMLPETVTNSYDQGLKEHAIFVDGENDGRFDTKDYILFFAAGPDIQYYSENDNMVLVKKNIYTRVTGLLIKFGTSQGKRIQTLPNLSFTNSEKTDSYIKVQHLEDQKVNLLHGRTVTYGSGKEWYGDYFKTTRKKEYTSYFNFADVIPNTNAKIKLAFAGRSDLWTELFLQVDKISKKIDIRNTNTSDVEDDIARETQQSFELPITTSSTLSISYPTINSPSEGWLNYITVNTVHPLKWSDKQFIFFNTGVVNKNASYVLSQASSSIEIWNITDELSPSIQRVNFSSSSLEFSRPSLIDYERFIAFDKNSIIPFPIKGKKISNQNLSAISDAESIILYYNDPDKPATSFEKAAIKLAQHRTDFSKIKSIAIPIDKVYNEFSAGTLDPTAIRNFTRLMYLNNPDFNYLTLLGDGSFDYLHLDENINYENFIPVYETDESLSPLYAFPSDDFYTLLEIGEGGTELIGDVDIAVGRIPARSASEADLLVNKIIGYDNQNSKIDDWKLRIAFAADDEDSNIHLDQAEEISGKVNSKHPTFNIQKIYLDAFKQESGAAGEIIPGCTESLFNNVYQGMLVFNYLGHGGYKGLSQEGLLRLENVESWSNKDKLPLIITATCAFCPFDDPNIGSAGEALFRSPYGGAIALLTTSRNVYSSSNKALTEAVFTTLFDRDRAGNLLTLGETMKNAKNKVTGFDRTNARKFVLIGDPAQRLSIPRYQVKTTKILSRPVLMNRPDTVQSLQLLKIHAEVVNDNGQKIENYNGTATITLFDKKSTFRTLGQNVNSIPSPFQIQNSVLFKGSAEVKNGDFEIEFVVPKDIDYKYGPGKLSYFTTNPSKIEATGYYDNLIIGGTLTSISDDKSPLIKSYINHYQFKNGDITHANPILLVDLFDDNGINATGNSIGHDLIATLDGKTQFVLNNFYTADKGNYQKGTVNFPMTGLSPGRHTIKVKAWDVANNSTEDQIDFIVIDTKSKAQILSLSAYPNPFSNQINISLIHNASTSQSSEIRYSISNSLGQTILQKSSILSPAPVVNLALDFNEMEAVPGVYYILVEILNAGRKIDSRGIKLLRIP